LYQRKDKKFQRERVFKAIFLIAVVITGGLISYILWFFGNLKNEFDLFFNGFDVESSLIDETHINYTLLDLRAQQIEDLIGKYHIPFNITGEGWDYYPPVSVRWSYTSAKFYNNTELLATFDPQNTSSPYTDYDNMTYAGDRAHTALYEGVYTMGEAFRYAWAKRNNNIGNMTAAEERILKIVKSYELLSYVSDKSVFVRYAVPNTTLAYQKFPGHWNPVPVPGQEYTPTNDHYITEYKGFKWSLSRHLSRDVSIGIMLGLSMTYALVDNATIREIAGRVIDRSVQYWYDSNWRIIDTDGTTEISGDFISARPFLEGGTILTFLQMGKMVNPEKWGSVYSHYAYDRGFAMSIGRSLRFGMDLSLKIFTGYYGCNFLFNNAPTLIFLERDPILKELYIRNWLNVLHDFTKLHRNANFDAVYLLCHAVVNLDNLYEAPTNNGSLQDYDMEIWKNANIKNPTDKAYVKEFMVRDIKDALMRYALFKYPNRDYWYATAPGTYPNVHQQQIDLDVGYPLPIPNYEFWKPDSDTLDMINNTMSLIGEGFGDTKLFNNSLPANMRHAEDIMWQRESFSLNTERLTNNPGSFQVPMGPEYLSVYWLAKYLELF
jgi:hypothetical protein